MTDINSQAIPASQRTVVQPRVSVVSATWQRHRLLRERCIPSIEAQDYPFVEHVIVSDGPDFLLADEFKLPVIKGGHSRFYFQLPEHDPSIHWGHLARLHGIEFASGDLITYCDDDDALRPDHVSKHVAALQAHPEAGFSYSHMASYHAHDNGYAVVGQGPPALGNIGTPMLMHRREVLEHGTWGPASAFEDWEIVHRWIDAGVTWTAIEEITADVWPSAFHHGQ